MNLFGKNRGAQSLVSEQGAEVLESKYPTLIDLMAIFGFFVLVQAGAVLAARGLISVLGLALDKSELLGWLAMLSSLISMPLLLLFIGFLRRRRGAVRPRIATSLSGFNPAILLCGFVMMLSATIALEPLMALLPSPPELDARGLPTIVAVVVLAPIFEELICRGVLFGSLRQKHGTVVAWVVSSLFFGLMHLHATLVLNGFFMGLILCYIYIRSRSIFAPILLHGLNNAVAYLFILLGWGGDLLLRDVVSSELLYTIIYSLSVLLLIGSTLYCVREFKRIAPSMRPTQEEYEEIFDETQESDVQ